MTELFACGGFGAVKRGAQPATEHWQPSRKKVGVTFELRKTVPLVGRCSWCMSSPAAWNGRVSACCHVCDTRGRAYLLGDSSEAFLAHLPTYAPATETGSTSFRASSKLDIKRGLKPSLQAKTNISTPQCGVSTERRVQARLEAAQVGTPCQVAHATKVDPPQRPVTMLLS